MQYISQSFNQYQLQVSRTYIYANGFMFDSIIPGLDDTETKKIKANML